ncbi:hypothetical protein JIN85_03190 [Luteolibacter pohnpeiensis]|uniref:Uncharacterized protein n=1 Tax=Luteolibacter pohnpeiensis TaxID=454153 RepID=A0A934VVD0_9BACT|nr:hypothetical protein [Luteolibacter pohnpeiensis]MBK1881404.1 hypothetical protein [Luteolibacter pohnpeiensis]
MKPIPESEFQKFYGTIKQGGFCYGDRISKGRQIIGGNPNIRMIDVEVAKYDSYERDEHQRPIVKPLPSKEEGMKIAREWMAKLGIDENEFYRHGDGPDGFDVLCRVDYSSMYAYGTKVEKKYKYGMTLNIAQQIGGLPAVWHGFGGSLACSIGDGGEFCKFAGTLRGWKKIGDYEVLNREEVTTALKEHFVWSQWGFECDRIEITKVDLGAYHARSDEIPKDFPLMYTLTCKIHGGERDGIETELFIPALRQHRQAYGPFKGSHQFEPDEKQLADPDSF